MAPKTGNTHHFPPGKKLEAMLSDFGNFLGHKCMLLVDSLDHGNISCWVLLWYSWEVTAAYALQKAWLAAPSFCIVTLGLILWTRLATGCGTCWEVMDHPHYSLYCTPIDLHLFVLFKKRQSGKWFAENASVKQAVTSWLQTFDTDFFCAWIEALVPLWKRCLNASYISHVLWSQTKVLSIRMFFILFLKLQSTWTYPLLLFSKFSSCLSTTLVDSFVLYPEYLLNPALFSVFCEFLLLGISPDILCACCSVGGVIFLWLHIGMVSCIMLFSKSVEWLSGSCLCL